MGQFTALKEALSQGIFATAKLSEAGQAWKTTDTGQVVTLGDDCFAANGDYGWQIVVRGDDDLNLYFRIGNDKNKNSLYDKDAKQYRIVFCEYLGKDTKKSNCFKAEPIV